MGATPTQKETPLNDATVWSLVQGFPAGSVFVKMDVELLSFGLVLLRSGTCGMPPPQSSATWVLDDFYQTMYGGSQLSPSSACDQDVRPINPCVVEAPTAHVSCDVLRKHPGQARL